MCAKKCINESVFLLKNGAPAAVITLGGNAFFLVDVVVVLTDQPDQRGASNYWAKLKQRLKEEGADQLLTLCQQLKMTAMDGKF